ncbi:MAG: hypothetical protein IJ776_05895 [Paludibacteraceae bacterium]|nr:hypothetical protein [Paludibacteraceae bacterium]
MNEILKQVQDDDDKFLSLHTALMLDEILKQVQDDDDDDDSAYIELTLSYVKDTLKMSLM